jgi:hypothetical protein
MTRFHHANGRPLGGRSRTRGFDPSVDHSNETTHMRLCIPFMLWLGVLQFPGMPSPTGTIAMYITAMVGGTTLLAVAYRLGRWRQEISASDKHFLVELVRIREDIARLMAMIERSQAAMEKRFDAFERRVTRLERGWQEAAA